MTEYEKCAFYDNSKGKCGPYTQQSTDGHIKFGFKNLQDGEQWSEKELIENKSKMPLDNSALICQHHRYIYGVSWQAEKHCKHPQSSRIQKRNEILKDSKSSFMGHATIEHSGTVLVSYWR